jgi:glutamine kinase
MNKPVVLGTKAEALRYFENKLKTAKVAPQICTTVHAWHSEPASVLKDISKVPWGTQRLVIRSSSRSEDTSESSLAGHFTSVLNVQGDKEISSAIKKVIESYGECNKNEVILIQPLITDVVCCGVAFGIDPNTSSPYRVINYDTSGSTSSVTQGTTNQLQVRYHFTDCDVELPSPLNQVVALLDELEEHMGSSLVDIEFAIDKDGDLFLLQVRPLVCQRPIADKGALKKRLKEITERIEQLSTPHPYLLGRRSIFGVMPDWNPAEIIGIRPKNLALSLYRELVTDSIWAYQRDNYGYRNLRSFPLLVSFSGLPYVDVRISFNSFIPKDLDSNLASRLVDLYIDRLEENPCDHDKVEFEIIYTCYTLDLRDRLQALKTRGFSDTDCEELTLSLRNLTNQIINAKTGLWHTDVHKIGRLEKRIDGILNSPLDAIGKIYWLLEDTKRYGTLPFAGLARAGFIAVQFLRSMVTTGILNQRDHDTFMHSLNTSGSQISRDLRQLSRKEFLRRNGHLRPGTYNIETLRYDEDPDHYFNWSNPQAYTTEVEVEVEVEFSLTIKQMQSLDTHLKEHKLDQSVLGLLEFIKGAIEGREYAKFVFTRGLSEALKCFGELGDSVGFSREECAHADIQIIKQLYTSSGDAKEVLSRSIREGRELHAATQCIVLPPLVVKAEDVWSFEPPPTEPSFVTQRSATGPVSNPDTKQEDLRDSILMIPSADPGYDWIFSHQIAGFITMYGGVNSHMAIRAGELRIPAVIGAGKALYNHWGSSHYLEVDCANRKVRKIQ